MYNAKTWIHCQKYNSLHDNGRLKIGAFYNNCSEENIEYIVLKYSTFSHPRHAIWFSSCSPVSQIEKNLHCQSLGLKLKRALVLSHEV